MEMGRAFKSCNIDHDGEVEWSLNYEILVYYLRVYSSNLIYRVMNKLLAIVALLLIASGSYSQVIGKVDRKTKEFSIAADQKVNFTVFGYQYANVTTQKVICFASDENVMRANSNLKLGSFFDTDRLPAGTRIMWLGMAGPFGKMSFITGGGKPVTFYIPKANFVVK